MTVTEIFLLITAIIYTAVGYYWAKKSNDETISNTIDFLIKSGYLVTEEKDGETHLVKIADET